MNTAAQQASPNSIKEVFTAQRAHQWVQRRTTAAQRIEKLKQLRAAIASHTDEIKAALHQDLRKSPDSVEQGDLGSTYHTIDDAIAKLESWMAPVEVETSPAFAVAGRSASRPGRSKSGSPR